MERDKAIEILLSMVGDVMAFGHIGKELYETYPEHEEFIIEHITWAVDIADKAKELVVQEVIKYFPSGEEVPEDDSR